MKILIFVSILISSTFLYATEQEQDILFFNQTKLALEIGWGHPSPLQSYFYQNNIKYPFRMLSTANYRGHLAHWEIINNKLYITKIEVGDSAFHPAKYLKKIKDSNQMDSARIFAGWFSGIIESSLRDEDDYWKVIKYYYFHVKNGVIVDSKLLDGDDFKKVQKITLEDTSDSILMGKYKMLKLNQNYIMYYYRLNEEDNIVLNDHAGLLSTGVQRLSPIYGYYNNSHLDWPYNWENLEKCGAPHCKWLIQDKKLYLTDVELYSGLELDSISSERLELSTLFKDKIADNKVYASWVNGTFLIKYGNEVADKMFPSVKRFQITEFTFIRINEGIITDNYTLPGDYPFKNLPEGIDPKLKEMIESFM